MFYFLPEVTLPPPFPRGPAPSLADPRAGPLPKDATPIKPRPPRTSQPCSRTGVTPACLHLLCPVSLLHAAMAEPELQLVARRIRSFPDFPIPGVLFR